MLEKDKPNPANEELSLTETLKLQTRELHEALEHEMRSEKLFRKDLEKKDYTNHLILLHRGHLSMLTQLERFESDALVEKYIGEERSVLQALFRDLKSLSVMPEADEATVDFLPSSRHAYGALYVVLGSNMGRSILGKRLRETILDWHRSAPEYYAFNASAMEAFQQFKNNLNELQADRSVREEVVQGAKATFSCFIAIAKEMNASVEHSADQ